MYNRNINKLSAIIQSPIAPRSTNVLWDDLVSNTLKVYRKGVWTVIGGAGGGGEGSSLYWGYDDTQGVIFPLDNRSVQINGDLTVNGDITARKLSIAELEIDGKSFTSYWELDSNTNTLSTTYQVLIKNSLVVEQDTSSGGEGEGGGGGLDESQLQDYLDLHKYVTEDDIAGLIPDVDLSDYYTKAQSDARYLALSGGTITGDLFLNQYLRINAYAGYGSGSANAWYNGNTQMLLWENVSNMGLGSNTLIHSGNIGSQWVDVANSLTYRVIPSDLTTIGPKTINWYDWAQSTGQGIASYSYGIWTGSPDINYGFGLGADAFADELYFKLMRGGTVGPWRRVITTADDGYIYGLGGYIDIQYSDEINRYGGNLYLQHRGGVGTTGSGTGGTTTGHILMCANGGNVLIGTMTDSGYKLDVAGSIKATLPIFGFMYGTNTNAAAFIFDKPGLNYTGIGSNGTSDTIRFGACVSDGTWVDGYAQNWKFYGDVKADKYRLNENDNSFIGTQVGYLSLNSMGNEICIGASGYNDIHINYRPSADGTAPKTYYWRAGSATSWADFYMGNTYIQGNLVVSGDVASA